MIRNAAISDCDLIAKLLWKTWQQQKAQQIPTLLHKYHSTKDLVQEIQRDLNHWLVCESADFTQTGYFGLSEVGQDKKYKKMCFPENAIKVDHFACSLKGDVILTQLQLLISHLPQASFLLCIGTQLRDAYWAALKAGFKLLGESPTIVGTYAWLYFDRAARFEEIQAKLLKAKIIAAQ